MSRNIPRATAYSNLAIVGLRACSSVSITPAHKRPAHRQGLQADMLVASNMIRSNGHFTNIPSVYADSRRPALSCKRLKLCQSRNRAPRITLSGPSPNSQAFRSPNHGAGACLRAHAHATNGTHSQPIHDQPDHGACSIATIACLRTLVVLAAFIDDIATTSCILSCSCARQSPSELKQQ